MHFQSKAEEEKKYASALKELQRLFSSRLISSLAAEPAKFGTYDNACVFCMCGSQYGWFVFLNLCFDVRIVL